MAKPNNMDIFKKNQGTESDYRNWKIGKTNISPSSFAKENCNGTDKLAILCTELLDDNIPDNQIQAIIFCRRRFLIVEYIKASTVRQFLTSAGLPTKWSNRTSLRASK